MATGPDHLDDDEALRWDGDESSRPVLPPGWKAKGRGADAVGTPDDPDATTGVSHALDAADEAEADAPPMGNATLIGLGVLGGVYALYVVGWIIGGLRLQGTSQSLLADAMFQGSRWLAVLAPIIWFATVFALTRARATWLRFAWLAAGAVLLVPWPFIMTGMVGR
nr:DNA polymerase III subunit gamma/tau [Microbacterium bovistercoris]